LVKLQQYLVYKLNTQRLRNGNYNIKLDLNQARKNGELISIGDSQMLRSLRWIKNIENSQDKINDLLQEKKRLKNKRNCSKENSSNLYEIEKEIDNILFVPEIIAVTVSNNKQYKYINENKFFVNNIPYVRLLCSAGNARRNTAIFIDENYEKELKRILNNDRNTDIELSPAKFNAYFSLASSATLFVSIPYFCVVPDKEIIRKEKVEFVEEIDNADDKIYECEKDITFNLFDGQGLISPRKAKEWADELDLDYIPSIFIIRSNFIKGMVCVFDFHKFAEENNKRYVTDVWGNKIDIRNIDIVLTQSQFKLWNAFNNIEHYITNCKKNNLGWGVSRYSHKNENNHTFLNYQFLQVLNLDKNNIEELCKKTLEYFQNTISNNKDFTLLYLLGKNIINGYDKDIIKKTNDICTKAIIYNNYLIDDPYIKNHIVHSLNKKIRESYIGNILVDGFYTTMVADPYALCEYIFSMEVKGLLRRNQHYNKYWLDRNKTKIAGMRAPLVWDSEVNILNLINNDITKEWYQYLDTCCIFNIHGCDDMILGGSDKDGDLICLTDQREIINNACGGLPIYYETKKIPKEIINESKLYLFDLNAFNSPVGFLTNISTTMKAMLLLFDKASKEHQELIRRLKQCRKEQGAIIDSTKGLIIRPIPKHWTKWERIYSDDSPNEYERKKFNNKIIVEKRPYFMRYLYSNYNKKYKKFIDNYNNYCIATFGYELQELLNKTTLLSVKEEKTKNNYYKYQPLLDTDCVINNICHYMENKIQEIKIENCLSIDKKLTNILKDSSIEINKNKLQKLYALYKKYKSEKRNFSIITDDYGEEKFKSLEQYNKYIKQESLKISDNLSELANMAVTICYEIHPKDTKAFCWQVFGTEILFNIYQNRQEHIFVPFLDNTNGNIEYLGNYYKNYEIEIDEDIIYDI
jgi:hypothetical protein